MKWHAIVFRWDKDYRKMPALLSDTDRHSDMVSSRLQRLSTYQELLAWAIRRENKERHLEHHELPKNTSVLSALEFLHPQHKDLQELFQTGSLNNLSYVIRITDGASALITGDIEPSGWKLLEENHPHSLKADVFKFPHHGAWKDGNIIQLLDSVDPRVIVISVGTSNAYRHPMPEVLAAIKARGNIRLLCTQATAQCGQQLKKRRAAILKVINAQDPMRAKISQRTHGCPCAGTIVIELSAELDNISPSVHQHMNQVITPFLSSPQCRKT